MQCAEKCQKVPKNILFNVKETAEKLSVPALKFQKSSRNTFSYPFNPLLHEWRGGKVGILHGFFRFRYCEFSSIYLKEV